MITFADPNQPHLAGSAGSLFVLPTDEITLKLAMLFEGQCEGLGATQAAAKFGYSKATPKFGQRAEALGPGSKH